MRYLLTLILLAGLIVHADRVAQYRLEDAGYSYLLMQEDSVSSNGVGQVCVPLSKISVYGKLKAIEMYAPNTGAVVRVYGTHPISGATQNILLESDSASGWLRVATYSTDTSTQTNEYGLITANVLTNTVPEFFPGVYDWTMLTTNCWTAGAKALFTFEE
jgi:hypothetical protein